VACVVFARVDDGSGGKVCQRLVVCKSEQAVGILLKLRTNAPVGEGMSIEQAFSTFMRFRIQVEQAAKRLVSSRLRLHSNWPTAGWSVRGKTTRTYKSKLIGVHSTVAVQMLC
jgi:hypothetical protein